MVNSNKVLTVSYGTFSCTLEGFDDSFGMMKAIAEYFRDLAADDRYFGAEPPTPDAEMLARIAEREIERRVDARLEKGSIVLRPSLTGDAAAPAAAPAPAPVSDTAVSQAALAGAAALAAARAEAQPAPQAAAVQPAPEPVAEDVAEVEPETAEEAEAGMDLSAYIDTAEDEDAGDETEAVDLDEDDYLAVGEDLAEEDHLDEVQDIEELTAPDPATIIAAPASDSVLAKLQRIRAVVSHSAEAEQQDTDYDEDYEHDAFLDDDVPQELIASHQAAEAEEEDAPLAFSQEATASDAIAEAELDEAEGRAPTEDGSDDAVAAILRDFNAKEEAYEEEAKFKAAIESYAKRDVVAEEDDLWDEDDEDDEEDWDEEAEAAEEDWDEDEELAELDALSELDGEEDMSDAPASEDFARPQPARVTKISRAAFDTAVARGAIQEVEDEEDEAPEPAPLSELSTLNEADEDALARELAALEAEIAAEEAELAELDAEDWDEEELDDEWDDEDLDDAAEAEDDLENLSDLEEADEDDEDGWDDEDLAEDEDDWQDDSLPAAAETEAQWDDDLDEDEDEDEEDVRPAAAGRAAPAPTADADEWDDYDEEDAEEDRKWAEAEARIKAEQAARNAEDAAREAEEAAQSKRDEMEATIERLARESVRKTVKLTSPARVMLTENTVEEDVNSVSRLMDQTNSELREPEGNRRRSAIAHLRAAVAATRADRILGRRRDEEKEKAAYQEALQEAVRPRRPAAGESRSERPRAAPLQLVAEQRVDEAKPAATRPAVAAQPVRPRRIGAEAAARPEDDEDTGFADFAEKMGATSLPDLLEAAAAYMSFVEGRDQFSRPQLMTKVRQAESGESSREDRLRSFGQLLREGKIQKTRGGRFTASEDIGFRPGDRAAG
ncbi:MAG: hypothetical protein KDK26_18325 [Roseivivax sp.]|nr:hypothetical protein [Roseivivax sp.]